jgi:hypothetical protein
MLGMNFRLVLLNMKIIINTRNAKHNLVRSIKQVQLREKTNVATTKNLNKKSDKKSGRKKSGRYRLSA